MMSRREVTLFVVWGLMLLLLAVVAPSFYDLQPLLTLLAREAPTFVVAAGMTLVVICRQIDISVGSQFALASVISGLLLVQGMPAPVALLASIVCGAAFGAINGALVAYRALPSIVVTLATLVAGREGLRWVRQGEFVNLPADAQWLGLSQGGGQNLVLALTAFLYLILGYILRQVAAGRALYAVGSDAEAARLSGLRPQRITFVAFVLLGAFTGLAAFLNLIQSPQVDPRSGLGMELRVIAAVVVGGVAIRGGRGTLTGVLAGGLLLLTISPALTHLHVNAYWEKAIQGAIILLAVAGDRKRRAKRGVVPA